MFMKKISREDVSQWLPVRDKDTYKNKMGHVLCIGGNENMGGAIILSASAALHSGTGLVSVASAPENVHALHSRLPEAMFLNMYDKEQLAENIQKADVIVIGPGLGLADESRQVFLETLATVSDNQWLIIDGDAITHFVNEKIETDAKNIILTPHLGEWRKLTEINPPAEDVQLNQEALKKLQATVILKKGRTEVYTPNDVWQNTAGNPSMATGGMGDTLTGIVASFLGQFENTTEALLSAVYVHSAAADELAETHYITLPTTIIEYLPIFMKNLEN